MFSHRWRPKHIFCFFSRLFLPGYMFFNQRSRKHWQNQREQKRTDGFQTMGWSSQVVVWKSCSCVFYWFCHCFLHPGKKNIGQTYVFAKVEAKHIGFADVFARVPSRKMGFATGFARWFCHVSRSILQAYLLQPRSKIMQLQIAANVVERSDRKQ